MGTVRHGDCYLVRKLGRTPEYTAWKAMKGRCYDPKNIAFSSYGGRGIKVCDRWRNTYKNFLEDMGRKPDPSYSLERIDNNGNYCPKNCKWASRAEQTRNTNRTRILSYDGITMCVADWAKKLGVSQFTLYNRLNKGYPIEFVLTSAKYHR